METQLDTVILIPYRNRQKQLLYFIQHSAPIINKYLPTSKIVVMRQTNDNQLFNRGKLLNVGFSLYKDKTKYFMTHDVDLNPTNLFVSKFYTLVPKENEVLALFTSIWNTMGGIIKLHNNVVHKINGFPNDIWGWGAEDSALQRRAEYFNISKKTFLLNNKKHPKYLTQFDDIDDRKKQNNIKNVEKYSRSFHTKNDTEKKHLIYNSGLNNIKYKVLNKTIINKVEIITVSI